MIIKHTPQAALPLVPWLFCLENLHGRTIDLGLKCVSQVAVCLGTLKPAPFVFTVAGMNGKGITCRTLEPVLMAAGYKADVYSSPHLVRYTERVHVQGQELPELTHTASFAEIRSARGDISLTYLEYGTLSALWLSKQVQPDIVILEVGPDGRLDATNIADADVAIAASIALDHTDQLGSDRENIGREKAGIFCNGKPAVISGPETPSTIADVAQEKSALLQRQGVEWNYSITGHDWTPSDVHGTLEDLSLSFVPQPNAVTVLTTLRASGLEISESAIHDEIASAILPGRFQVVSESPRVIFDIAYNPHTAEYLTGRMKALPKSGRVLAVISMLHDKGITGTLVWLKSMADGWYHVPLGEPHGTAAEQLLEHLGNGKPFNSVVQAWDAAMAGAKAEDAALVCGSFHTAVHVMEVIDVRRSGGK